MTKANHSTDCRQLTADEIDYVSGGYGGYTNDGKWITCGTVVVHNGTIYIGGINGPVPMGTIR